ncbi:MAG: flagellar FliJ family protein [Butyrivibrio sp.]|nr:flagellar FliJ family protein [Butyrivibrio sp.]
MARFVYRMEGILNLKLKQEEQQKLAFGEAAAALNEQEERLAELRKRQQFYVQEGVQLRTATLLDLPGISENQYAQEQMKRIVSEQEEVVEQYRLAFERQRLKLTQAIQERRMQERLKERAHEEYLEEEKQAEFRETDERTSYTYAMRE